MTTTPDTENLLPLIRKLQKEALQREKKDAVLERRVKELAAVNALAREVSASLSLDQVVAVAYAQIQAAVNPDVTVVYLKKSDKLVLQKQKPDGPQSPQIGSEILKIGQCLCGLVVENGTAQYSKNIHKDHRCSLDDCKKAGICSFAALPLRVEKEVLGVLGVGSRKMCDLAEWADFLETLASQVAVALKNAVLYEQVKHYSAKLDRQVSELTRSKETLLASEERYRRLYETSPVVIFNISAADGSISSLNPAFEKVTGWPAAEWIGRPFAAIVHPDDLAVAEKQYQKVLNGETISTFGLRINSSSGDIVTGDFVVQPEVKDGSVIGAFGIARDITAHVRAERALQESEAHLRSLMETAANFAIFRLVRDEEKPRGFKVVFVSPSIADIMGVAKPMKFETWFENIHADDAERVAEASRRAFKTLKFEERIQIYHETNREWRWIRAIASYIPDHGGDSKYVNGILFDVTEIKKAEQELEIRTRNLEEANAALKVLLKQREEDRTELEDKVLHNVKDTIVPYLEKLKDTRLNERQNLFVNILESNLKDIVSSFSRSLSFKYLNLTPAEIQIANLIKQGKSTKDIADLLNLSSRTINFHRENIRDKLGLKNQKANLRSYLLSLE